jgi:hypothetical protein
MLSAFRPFKIVCIIHHVDSTILVPGQCRLEMPTVSLNLLRIMPSTLDLKLKEIPRGIFNGNLKPESSAQHIVHVHMLEHLFLANYG